MVREPKLPLFVPRKYSKLNNNNIMDRILLRVNHGFMHYDAGTQPFRLIEMEDISEDYFQMTFGIQSDNQQSIRRDMIVWLEHCVETGLPFSEMFFDFACRGWDEGQTLAYVRHNDMYNSLRRMYYRSQFDLPKNVAPGDEWEYMQSFYNKSDLSHYSLVGYNADSKVLTYPMTFKDSPILNGVDFVYRLRFQKINSLVIQTIDTTKVEL